MKIDVVLLTKNSFFPCLPECLDSLIDNVPINRLIVVDGGSTDQTLQLIKSYNIPTLIIHDPHGNRATSRQKGIEAVETEWFLFLDSDVVLHPKWYDEAVKSITSKVGAVQGSTIQLIEPIINDFDYAVRRLRSFFGGLTYKPFLEPVHRGFTGDILIKTDLVKDIKIPKLLHIFEDHYIKCWIENKGYRWVRSSTASCDHFMVNRSHKASYSEGYIGFIIGYHTVIRSLIALVTIFPKLIFALWLRPNLKMAWWQLRFQFWSFIGVLKAYLTAKQRLDIKMALKFKVGARKEKVETSPNYIEVI